MFALVFSAFFMKESKSIPIILRDLRKNSYQKLRATKSSRENSESSRTMNNNQGYNRMPRVSREWSDFYSSILPSDMYANAEYSTTFLNITMNGNVWVYGCYFHYISSPTYGGAIDASIKANFLAESSTFHSCRADYFGAIRLIGGNGVYSKLCGYNCHVTTNIGFAGISGDTNRIINSVQDTSVSHCTASQNFILYHQNGYTNVTSLNTSFHSAKHCPSFSSLSNQVIDGYGNRIHYCSFVNNSANDSNFVVLGNASEILCSNFIRLSQVPQETQGLIHTWAQSVMIRCCIIENVGYPIISNYKNSSSLILSQCTIGGDQLISTFGTITETNPTDIFINNLTFLVTGMCENIFDTLGNMTQKPPRTTRSSSNDYQQDGDSPLGIGPIIGIVIAAIIFISFVLILSIVLYTKHKNNEGNLDKELATLV